jgi:glyoxylase-like metal-dependent hydrolase (beta-lactamase superfamily II)
VDFSPPCSNEVQGKGSKGGTLSLSLLDQRAQLGLDSGQTADIGISHYHYDHTGQADDFHQVRLLLGHRDAEVLREPNHPLAQALTDWLSGSGILDEGTGDR